MRLRHPADDATIWRFVAIQTTLYRNVAMAGVTEHVTRLGLSLRGWKSRRVRTRVGEVHLLDVRGHGSLPPMVFLHGFTSAGSHYGSLLVRLRRAACRVIVPDLPAHGFSDVPPHLHLDALYDGLYDALDATLDAPAVVVGNSMGGALGLRYALDRPSKVLGLALVAPGGAPLTASELTELKKLFRVRTRRDALRFVDHVMVRPGAMRELYAMGILAGFDRPVMRDLLEQLTPDHAIAADQLRGLKVPVRVLWGAEERVFPPTARAFFEKHLPFAGSVDVHPGIGHCAHLDDCARTASWIVARSREFVSIHADADDRADAV